MKCYHSFCACQFFLQYNGSMKLLIDKLKLKLLLERRRQNLDEILHKFSLAVIKDTFNEFSNRFLLYFDKAWDCWFFFSFPTSDYQNEASIVQRLFNKLKVDANSLSLANISDRI